MAGVLTAVGAITEETEEDVVDGLRAALTARGRIEQDALLDHYGFGVQTQVSCSTSGGHPMRPMAGQTAAGPPRRLRRLPLTVWVPDNCAG
jgi:hypothetical protein